MIDSYGYDKLVKWQTGAGDEFSASHAFERGKLAMMLDGEWRVAFLKAEHPELAYGTAPMPVDTSKTSLYGSGYINGTIIGIPKSGKNRDEAWELVKYLTTNDHALATFSNGIRNVPSTVSSTKSKELKPDANFATFGKLFVNVNSTTIPITQIGADHLTTAQNFIAKWQAGKVKDLHGGLVDVDKQIDAKLKQAGGGGRRAVTVAPAPGEVLSTGSPAIDRRRARARAAWRRRLTVLAFLSPWLVGFAVFFGYPLVMTGYLSFFHYDLLNPPRWVGLANYRYLFGEDAQIWPAVKNTLWFIAVSVPLQVLFAFGISVMLTRAQRGRRALPDRLLPPRARAARGGDARLRLPAQPRHRAGQHDPRAARDQRAALVQRSRVVEAVARACSACGASATR